MHLRGLYKKVSVAQCQSCVLVHAAGGHELSISQPLQSVRVTAVFLHSEQTQNKNSRSPVQDLWRGYSLHTLTEKELNITIVAT